jgi:pheromone shutdown protein TraB
VLSKRAHWANRELKQVVRNKQLATLMVNLLPVAYQKQLGGQSGIKPEAELLTGRRSDR